MIQKTFDYGGLPDPPPSSQSEGSEPVDARWDDGLDSETREFVQKITDEIHGQMKRTAEGIIRIGQNLIAVKERLRHGQFLPWLKAEFAMSENAALKFMQVAERFGSKSINFMNLSASVLYELAAPSTKDEVVEKVLAGSVEATLEAIRAEKEALKRRADKAERARAVVEQQLQHLIEEVTVLQRQLEERPQVVQVENPETEAALARLKQQYAEKEVQLKQKIERVKVLSAELEKHAHRDEQETYRQQVRYQWRRTCEAFHQGIKEGMARMVIPFDAASAFEGDDWARRASVESALKRAMEELARLREGGQIIEANG